MVMCFFYKCIKYFWQSSFVVLGVQYVAFAQPVLTHSDAQTACQNTTMKLASFVSEDNINSFKDIVQNIDVSFYWTGLKYTKSSDTWSFVDGADTTFAVANLTLPQSIYSDQCVMIHRNGNLVQLCSCTEGRPFVCQQGQHPTHPPITTSTG